MGDITAGEITLDKDDYIKLVNGKFKTFKCTTCDGKGWFWVRDDGEIMSPGIGESEDDFYRHPCDDEEDGCNELGFNVVFDE